MCLFLFISAISYKIQKVSAGFTNSPFNLVMYHGCAVYTMQTLSSPK